LTLSNQVCERARVSSAKILTRSETQVSPWVRLVAKQVAFDSSPEPQTYHCLAQADYVAVIARDPDGRLAIVRQFRPAVERETWELPAGLAEPDETADRTAARELYEETGLTALKIEDLGTLFPDTGRLENRTRVLAVEASPPAPGFVPEAGMSVALVTPTELRAMVRAGEFAHQLHLGALAFAELKGFATGLFR
jgi:8-oxo-dGTP pyrophosphatase MutT (NUDIX family)